LAPGGRHPSSGGAARLGRWRGEVLLVDCRRDYIDCRLNIHYPLDAIFRPSLSCQRPTLGEQLVSRFLKGLQIGLCRWH